MTILVTGGAGYVGSHAVRELRSCGLQCVVLDNLSRGHRELVHDAELIIGDIGDRSAVTQVIRDFKVTSVMHFAALAYVEESVQRPSLYYENNVAGTVNLLNCMLQAGIRRLVFSSTCAIYGLPERIPITEDHAQRPINPYGASKLMVERILQDYDRAHGLQSVTFRYFNAAGADPAGLIGELHEPETHLIPLAIQVAQGLRPAVEIFGDDYPTPDGTCVRDYVHVCDLATAHVQGLRYLESGGSSDAFNLGNGKGFSVRAVLDSVQRVTGQAVPRRVSPRRPGDPHALVGSADKALRHLAWQPRFDDLDEIVSTAWQWHRRRQAAA